MKQNRLNNETSPYLLQHKDNPVWWHPWNENAFDLAAQEQKPIFLSIGYSTCHWCHVMERESFENQELADILNEHFISIKVDREERPDIDSLYMTAVQMLTGRGGWPMSVWLTSDGSPFFAGTYFPSTSFAQILTSIAKTWQDNQHLIVQDSEKLTAAMSQWLQNIPPSTTEPIDRHPLANFITEMQRSYDKTYGGFSEAPKFPDALNLRTLLRLDNNEQNPSLRPMIETTLLNMANLGMYDQLYGGFHRYSTDAQWIVPHFEKMLYDQAMLVPVYLEAYQKYHSDDFRAIAEETLNYVLKDLTHPQGGFYCAQDADSLSLEDQQKHEGHFATWDFNELKAEFSEEEWQQLNHLFYLTEEGHYEGRNILLLNKNIHRSDKNKHRELLEKLRRMRQQRPEPHRDEKVLTSWNGWMIAAFAQASRVLDDPRYLIAAKQGLRFIQDKLFIQGQLHHSYCNGEVKVTAFAEDYAGLIHALIETYQTDFDAKWITFAQQLQSKMNELFWTDSSKSYFSSDGSDPHLILRTREDYDGVTPSSNSLSCYNLLRLYDLTHNDEYLSRAENIMNGFGSRLTEQPRSLGLALMALDYKLSTRHQVAVITDNPSHFRFQQYPQWQKNFMPHVIYAVGENELPLLEDKPRLNDQTTFYICGPEGCLAPTNDFSKIREQLL